jgi:hypothetical protein
VFGCPIFQTIGRKQNYNVTETQEGPKIPQKFTSDFYLVSNRQPIRESYSENSQKAHRKRGLLNASQSGFHVRRGTKLQCMKLAKHATLNLNNNMSTAAVFLDIENAFATT